jgi:acetyl esterase
MADTSKLDPSAAAWLAAASAAGAPPVQALSPEQARAAHEAASSWLSGPGEDVESVEDLDVFGVPVRLYRPEGAGAGVVVYVHGGGWVVGTLDTYDTLCRALANRCGHSVASVGYTLAPEGRHPLQAMEVSLVLAELVGVLDDLPGGGERPLAVAGDSAGAHLAALAASSAECALAMIYPVIAPIAETPSRRELATGFLLTTEAMEWYADLYLPMETGTHMPVDARDRELSELPPTMVLVAGHDPLRDEGLSFADAVEAAGVPVERVVFPGQLHGFVRALAQIPEAYDALDQVGAFLRGHLTK